MESISTMTNIGSISASHVIDYDDFNKVFIFISLSRDPLFPSSIYSWNTWAYKYNGVTFNAPPTPPTISLTATPASVAYSGTSVITWTSTNSTSCTKSWGANGTGGAYTTPVLTTNTTYAISCTGSGGIATGSVTVGVGSAPIQPG